MKTFVIDSDGSVVAFASGRRTNRHDGGTRFSTEKKFAALSKDWPMSQLVGIWNRLPSMKPVQKFKDRKTALRRIWAALQALEPETKTKTDLVIDLIKRPSGATLAEIMAATGWQAHSIRGFICVQPKKRGFEVESFKREDERVYRIR